MSEPDLNRFRGVNESNVAPQDFIKFLIDTLNTSGYSMLKTHPQTKHQETPFNDNQSFWDAVSSTKTIRDGDYVYLKRFHVTSWIPLSPGTYSLPESKDNRKTAAEFWSHVRDEYLPLGKLEMILSGVGSVRLKSIPIDSKRYFLLSATADGVTHAGIPVCLAYEEDSNKQIFRTIDDCGGCVCNISGHIEVVPKGVTSLNYNEKIPKYCIFADNVDYREPSQKNLLTSTAAIMFQNFYDYQDYDRIYSKKWSYCSFNPSGQESLDKAVDWLKDYTMRYEHNPIVLNDFDEYHDYFTSLEFPLNLLRQGIIDTMKLGPYKRKYNIQVHARKVVMGDSFEVGDVGPGATIINKSWVIDSVNKVEREYGEETKKALEDISKFIERSNNPSAAALFNGFTQELKKPQHDKSTLKGIWDNIVKVLPSIATISGAVAQITALFV